MSNIITIGIGIVVAGAIGTFLRVLITDLDADFNRQMLGTVVVNVAGSFALGFLSTANGNTALIIGVGGLGALTTFSTFISQVECIDREASREKASAYVLGLMIVGVIAALVGIAIGS